MMSLMPWASLVVALLAGAVSGWQVHAWKAGAEAAELVLTSHWSHEM